jgi:hypothetical protein
MERYCPSRFFEQRKWRTLKGLEMMSIGQVFAVAARIDIDGESKRRKKVLLKWT